MIPKDRDGGVEGNLRYDSSQVEFVQTLVNAPNFRVASGHIRLASERFGISPNQKWDEIQRQTFEAMGLPSPTDTVVEMVESGLVRRERLRNFRQPLSLRQGWVIALKLLGSENREIAALFQIREDGVKNTISCATDKYRVSLYGMVAIAAEDKNLVFAKAVISLVKEGLVDAKRLPEISVDQLGSLPSVELDVLSWIVMRGSNFAQIGRELKMEPEQVRMHYLNACRILGYPRLRVIGTVACKLKAVGKL